MVGGAGGVLVGRDPELAELEAGLASAVAGRGRAVLISGDAGMGKTSVVDLLSQRAGEQGVRVLVGQAIDLIGTELPYQPFVEALGPLGGFAGWHQGDTAPGMGGTDRVATRVDWFEGVVGMLAEDARRGGPLVILLEDLHWADVSTLDLFAFLAHRLRGIPLLLVATFRADEVGSADRLRRFSDTVGRAPDALRIHLGPLGPSDVRALIDAVAGHRLPGVVVERIQARCEGNPFFARELLSADTPGELPQGLSELLLRRLAGLDSGDISLLRLAASAGHQVTDDLLRATAGLAETELEEILRRAVDRQVLVVDHERHVFRFRHALLAEAIQRTVLPSERRHIHRRLAEALTASGSAGPAELAPHWAAAGCTPEALSTSVQAARQAQAVFGLAEARAHAERALSLWDSVAEPARVGGVDLGRLCGLAAELASLTGDAPRAVELARRALGQLDPADWRQAAHVHDQLGRYLHESGRTDLAMQAFARVVELVAVDPPSPERADALAALGEGLSLLWRFGEAVAPFLEALAVVQTLDVAASESRVRGGLGRALVFVGRTTEGLAHLHRSLDLAVVAGDPRSLVEAYVRLTDVLMILGRLGDAARFGRQGLGAARRTGVDNTVLLANTIEPLLALGDWDEADRLLAGSSLSGLGANFPYMLLMLQADLAMHRGRTAEARADLDETLETLRPDRGQGVYDVYRAELALTERRWLDAVDAADQALRHATSPQAHLLQVWFCAKGLRAQAELAAVARAGHDHDRLQGWLARADRMIGTAREAASRSTAVTPVAPAWLALAEAEHRRAHDTATPDTWSDAAAAWRRLGWTTLTGYCRWRQAEALVAAGASAREANVPAREAHAIASRIGWTPLRHDVELLAQRARLDLTTPPPAETEPPMPGPVLGLTPRESEILALIARGQTNREIAEHLVISVKTASVHVSNILRKLGVSNRVEAAAVAHRLRAAPP